MTDPHLHDLEPEKDNRLFWVIIGISICLVVAFVAEIFVKFYLDVV